jgi:hypothetical protein
VTDALRRTDRVYAGATRPDRRFLGYAADHEVVLDFGDRLAAIPESARPVLLLDGWVEYSTSTSNYAASQSGLRLKAPSVAVERDGAWVELAREVGYPAGLNHVMTLDLAGRLRRGDRRLSSHHEHGPLLGPHRPGRSTIGEAVKVRQAEVPVRSADLHFLGGIDAVPVEVEVDTAPAQMPKTVLVGLPELVVRESIHRIERALVNLGYRLPTGRTIINLAPADLRKDAGAFDLPIALGMLVATGQITADTLDGFASVGELALDGSVRPVAGALSMAMEARARGVKRLVVPAANAARPPWSARSRCYGVGSLADAVGIVVGAADLEPVSPAADEVEGKLNRYDIDFADVKGQEFAKRALTVAASGRAQRPDARQPRQREDDAGPPAADDPAAADARREPGDDPHLLGRRQAAGGRVAALHAAVPQPAPHDQRRRHGRRRHDPAAGRDLARAPRRAVPRRTARVQPPQPGGAAPAAGRGPGDDQPGGPLDHVPGRLHAGRGDEPLPVRFPRRPEAPVQVRADRRREVHGPHLGAAAGPHRPAHRGAAGAVRGPVEAGRRHRQRADARGGVPGARARSRRSASARARAGSTAG